MRKILVVLVAGIWSLVTVGCGGGGSALSTSSNPGSSGASTHPMMVTVGDAPLNSILAAKITVSAVNATTSSGSVSLLSQPKSIELSSLGGVRTPLELSQVPAGTYTGASVTVSAAHVVYVDPSTGQVTVKDATINNGTVSVTFASPLTVTDTSAEADVRLDFDLANSLDLTNGTLTFSPVIKTAAAFLDKEKDTDRGVTVSGKVTAISGNTITVQSLDGNTTVTLKLASDTHFDDQVTPASLQVGSIIEVRGKLQDDGSILVTSLEADDHGDVEDSHSMGGLGVVTAVTTDSNHTVTGFQMVLRRAYQDADIGKTVNVQVTSNTVFHLTFLAQLAGMTSFDASQLFPGQSVLITGTVGTDGSIVAREIRPAPTTANVTLATAPASGQTTFTVALDANAALTKLAQISSLAVGINNVTILEGSQLAVTGLANLAVGSPLTVRGYLSQSNGAYTLNATRILLTSE